MSKFKFPVLFSLVCFMIIFSGCNGQVKDLKIQNETQRKRIAELDSEVQTLKLKMQQMVNQLEEAQKSGGIEAEALKKKMATLGKLIDEKNELIKSMQQQLLSGGVQLPMELNTLLEDFAQEHDMVSFDASRGLVKFNSDLLFEPGSAIVAQQAADAVKSLCSILNNEQAKKFDIIIAGHTDDVPIGKPETRQKHPTNWHLSAHRAISVLQVMKNENVEAERVSVRGFGEYRPIEANKPDKKGNPLNRRVEIYIVAKGV